jgi:hypothetical protein
MALVVALLGCSRSDPTPEQEENGPARPTTMTQARINRLHPDFPVVEGEYRMTEGWSIILPKRFNRRVEGNSLVIWRPGFTIWITVWGNDRNESKEEQLAWIKTKMSPDAFDLEELSDDGVLRFAYRLKEKSDDNRVAALYGFAFGDDGYVQTAIYFDDEAALQMAKTIWKSLKERPVRTP